MEDLNFELEEKEELLPGNNNQIKFYRKTGSKVMLLFWLNIATIASAFIAVLALIPIIASFVNTYTGSISDEISFIASFLIYIVVYIIILNLICLAMGVITISLGSADSRFTIAGIACIAGQAISLVGNILGVLLSSNVYLNAIISLIAGILYLVYIYFFVSGMEDLVYQASASIGGMWSTFRKFYLIAVIISLVSGAIMLFPSFLAFVGAIAGLITSIIEIILVIAWYILLFKSGRAMKNYM